jgi:hypothetical protein
MIMNIPTNPAGNKNDAAEVVRTPLEIVLYGGREAFAVQCGDERARMVLNVLNLNMMNYLIYWGLGRLRDILWRMPLAEIKFNYLIEEKDAGDLTVRTFLVNVFSQITGIVETTNARLKEVSALKDSAAGHENILFYVDQDDYRMLEFYEHLRAMNPERLFLRRYNSGWNALKRCFEPTPEHSYDLQELLAALDADRIEKIVGTNYFLYTKYLEGQVYLPAVLRFLGIEFIGIDFDPIELYPISGVATRRLFQNDDFRRFTCFPSLHQYWDEKQQNRNVYYPAVVRHYPESRSPIALAEDYSVVVLSNSRFESVRKNLKMLLYILEGLEGGSFITELQVWYLAARRIILEKLNVDDYVISEFCKLLMNVWYAASQLLKYEVIENVETDRTLRIYGDQGWARLFPEYYQNRYLTAQEIGALEQSHNALYLLLNNNLNYLEASGTVYDCICRNNAFINFPATFKTADLQDLARVEYDDARRLNELIANAGAIYKNAELEAAIHGLRQLYRESENSVTAAILAPSGTPYRSGPFERQVGEHRKIMDGVVGAYLAKHERRIARNLESFYDPPVDFDVTRSKYAGRRYVKALLETS